MKRLSSTYNEWLIVKNGKIDHVFYTKDCDADYVKHAEDADFVRLVNK